MKIQMCLVKLKLIRVVMKQQKMAAYMYTHIFVVQQLPRSQRIDSNIYVMMKVFEKTWSII
jgi:hypothetical protein